jgi:hypothetical protein
LTAFSGQALYLHLVGGGGRSAVNDRAYKSARPFAR